MNQALIRLLLAMASRSVERGTLVEIVQTFAKLVHLIEPLLDGTPGRTPGQ